MNFQYILLLLLSTVGILAWAQFSLCVFVTGAQVCGELKFNDLLAKVVGVGVKDKKQIGNKPEPPGIAIPKPTYDVVVNFTRIEDVISSGFDVVLSPELVQMSNKGQGLNIDRDFFTGYTVIVVGIFKKGKSWFCQKLSNVNDEVFLAGQDVSTDGFSIKRVKGQNYAYNIVDVQGSGVPVEKLSTEALIHQQILEEIIQEAAFQVGHAYIQVINDFTNADQALMLLTATKALANDVGKESSDQSLFFLVHNLRDKQLSEFPGYFRKNVLNKLPNGVCLPIDDILISDENSQKLSKVPGFNEKLCGELLPGRFYMAAEINGKTTYHYFLVSEYLFGGNEDIQQAAVAMNDIAVYHIRFSIQTMLGNKKGPGIVQPLLDAISSEIPKYLTNAPVAVLKKKDDVDDVDVDIEGVATAAAAEKPMTLDNGAIRFRFQEGLRVRSELYEVIPTARLPLPAPPIPYRIYQNFAKDPDDTKKIITTAIVVELELTGFDVSNFNKVGLQGAMKKNGKFLEITLFKKPQHLTKLGSLDLVEVFSERKFGIRTTKVFIQDSFSLPANRNIKLCEPDNGVNRIIIMDSNYEFDENDINCGKFTVVEQLPSLSDDNQAMQPGNIVAQFLRRVYKLVEHAVTRRD